MEICSLCKCQSVDNNRCLNCGQILGIVPVRLVQGGNALITIDMTVTDRYLVFRVSDNSMSTGDVVATAAGGLIGSAIFSSVKNKQNDAKIGMIDLRMIKSVEFLVPSSKISIGAIHIYINNGKDYYFGINESGTKKLNLPVAVNAIKYANIYTTIQNVKKVPRLKANDPFYKKGKEVFVTVSRSATAFIAPFKGMIVVD